MASNDKSTFVLCTKVQRFSEQDDFNVVFMDVSQDGCRLAVSGYNDVTEDTFIDLFTLKNDSDSQDKSLCMTSQPYFSKEYAKPEGSLGLPRRCVCLLGDSVFVTCCSDTIESYDTEHGGLANQGKLNGEARCMTTRDGTVYVGLVSSREVIVFDQRLNQINTITLNGLEDSDYPEDIIVNNNKMFVCTFHGRALMYNKGNVVYEFKTPNHQYNNAWGITVSEENEFIYILWSGRGKCVVVYSLPGGLSSPSGCHFLASFHASGASCRIRINNNVSRLLVVSNWTGEIFEYHTSDIINFENLLTLTELLIEVDDLLRLLKYFKIPTDKAKAIRESDDPFKALFQHLRENGKLNSGDKGLFLTACDDNGITKVIDAWTNYQQLLPYQKKVHQLQESENQRRQLTEKLAELENDQQELTKKLEETQQGKEELDERLSVAEREKQKLCDKLRESDSERVRLKNILERAVEEKGELKDRLKLVEADKRELTDRSKRGVEEREELTKRLQRGKREHKELLERLGRGERENGELTGTIKRGNEESREMTNSLKREDEQKRDPMSDMRELEEIKSSLKAAKDELLKTQVKYAKESMALQEVLKQTREALGKQEIIPTDSEKDHTIPTENETQIFEESAILAADYGRLVVDVAEDLTLDNTLQLAYLLRLPNSEKDMLRRISLVETPGITLIKFMKTRNIINMYDVTNLQKGLVRLHLHSTNEKYVVPYQQKVDQFLHDEKRSTDLLDWPDENGLSQKENKTVDCQEFERRKLSEKSQNGRDKEMLAAKLDGEEIPRLRQHSPTMNTMQRYIEHKITDEGGTINLMGVCLSIPDEALSSDHVIAVTVIRDPGVLLPECVQGCRMTPLIKLEPKGLKLSKAGRLTIPFSTVIPESDCPSVMVFTGHERELVKGRITWKEEKYLQWKLQKENISLDISTLSYIFVNFVSQEMEHNYTFRVVPFVDGILNTNDDVFITVCLCKDNDAEYKLLLEDFKSKMTIGDHSTFQFSRALNDANDAVPCLELVMSSRGDSYHLNKEEAKQVVDPDRLCAASRVSHQFRLRRREEDGDIYTDMFDVMLKVSQGDKNHVTLILQSRIRDILLSTKSQDLLFGEIPRGLQQYENLKKTISRRLDKHQCEKLAVFFGLTPAENDKIQKDSEPGMVLMKILDKREVILPDKMIALYEGLKATHLNKIGQFVLEHVDASQNNKMVKSRTVEVEKKKLQADDKKDISQERKVLKLSKNNEILTKEGYKKIDAQLALKLSPGKLDLARRLLRMSKHKLESRPPLSGSTFYKEQYMINMEERWTYLIFISLYHLVHYILDRL